jgi:hypothetical protein
MATQFQIILTNDLGAEIYRSDISEVEEGEDLTETVHRTLQVDCIELNVGDILQIKEVE